MLICNSIFGPKTRAGCLTGFYVDSTASLCVTSEASSPSISSYVHANISLLLHSVSIMASLIFPKSSFEISTVRGLLGLSERSTSSN